MSKPDPSILRTWRHERPRHVRGFAGRALKFDTGASSFDKTFRENG
jgi:hypothetical protein